MPESTEVLEYTQFINSKFKNKILENVKILKGRYKKHKDFTGYKTLKSGNYKLLDVKSKGKFMYIEFEKIKDRRSPERRSKETRSRTLSRSRSKDHRSPERSSKSPERISESIYLGVTLGLSGGWFYGAVGSKERSSKANGSGSKDRRSSSKLINGLDTERFDDDEASKKSKGFSGSEASKYLTAAMKHINVEFTFNSGTLYFYDQLSYGTLTVLSQSELDSKLKKIGKDMGDPDTTFDDFYDALKGEASNPKNLSKPIGNLIVNQKIISGVGNYLRADSLWASKISPFRKLKDISKAELKNLYHQIRILIYGAGSKSLKTLGKKLKIIASKDKFPSDYDRGFWIYKMETDIHGHEVIVDTLYEGSQKRFIYYTLDQK
jgi:formamidopyrimidine-DNA glycosylase